MWPRTEMFWEAFQKQNFNTRKLFLISIILYEVSSLLRPCPECGLADWWSECRGWSGAGVTCCSLGADATEWTLQYRHSGLGFSNCYVNYIHNIIRNIQRKVFFVEFKDPVLRYYYKCVFNLGQSTWDWEALEDTFSEDCVSKYNDVKIGEP